jgi:hypothetical protein
VRIVSAAMLLAAFLKAERGTWRDVIGGLGL